MLDKDIILSLIEKCPQWFIILGCVCFTIHKLCNSQLKHISKLLGKHLIKNNNTLDKINKRLDNIESDINELKKNDKEQNEFINMVLNKKGVKK